MSLSSGMTLGHIKMESQGEMLRMFEGKNANFAHQTVMCLRNRFVDLVSVLRPVLSVEVGAHDGHYSRLLREKYNTTGRKIDIIAIEANPLVYEKYKNVMEAANIDYRNIAVANSNGKLVFKVPLTRDGVPSIHMGSLLDFPHSKERIEYEVDCNPLSEIVNQTPFVLWVDVEGANREVFSGVSEILKDCLAILVEVEEMELWPGQMLASEFITFCDNNHLVPVLRDSQKYWQYNMIFVKRELQHDPRVEDCCRSFFADVRAINDANVNT